MMLCGNRVFVCGLLLGLTALVMVAQPLRAQDRPPRPDTKPQPKDIDQARAEVCRALEQLRDAETKLRQAEKRLRELEGKGTPAQDKTESDIHIFPLRNAKAAAVARTLEELFGGDRLRIVADPATNSLLIRGKAQDLETIQALLSRLDVGATEPEDELAPHVYPLKNTSADALAKVLRESFGKDRAAIAVDATTNSLIVRAMRNDQVAIARLIVQLDEMAAKVKPPERKNP